MLTATASVGDVIAGVLIGAFFLGVLILGLINGAEALIELVDEEGWGGLALRVLGVAVCVGAVVALVVYGPKKEREGNGSERRQAEKAQSRDVRAPNRVYNWGPGNDLPGGLNLSGGPDQLNLSVGGNDHPGGLDLSGSGDLDCADIGHSVNVGPVDPNGLDADGDGVGCE